jgi:hypothetical protein
MKGLKRRWGLKSNLQLGIVLLVFALTGSTAVYVSKPILAWIKFDTSFFSEAWWGMWLYQIGRLLIIFPLYLLLLFFFGWLFGQFNFFWGFGKKIISRFGLGFLFK